MKRATALFCLLLATAGVRPLAAQEGGAPLQLQPQLALEPPPASPAARPGRKVVAARPGRTGASIPAAEARQPSQARGKRLLAVARPAAAPPLPPRPPREEAARQTHSTAQASARPARDTGAPAGVAGAAAVQRLSAHEPELPAPPRPAAPDIARPVASEPVPLFSAIPIEEPWSRFDEAALEAPPSDATQPDAGTPATPLSAPVRWSLLSPSLHAALVR